MPEPYFDIEAWFNNQYNSISKVFCLNYDNQLKLYKILELEHQTDGGLMFTISNSCLSRLNISNSSRNIYNIMCNYLIDKEYTTNSNGICIWKIPDIYISYKNVYKYTIRGNWDNPNFTNNERMLAWQNECLRTEIMNMYLLLNDMRLSTNLPAAYNIALQ
jgi:hypothetical protein